MKYLNRDDIKYYGKQSTVIVNKEIETKSGKDIVPFITFPLFAKANVIHGFSTRLGGVSSAHLSSMNLGINRGDDKENVLENYERIAKAIGFSTESIVFSEQQHTANIRIVSSADCGKGLFKERDYEAIDGLLTDEPGITFATFFADCIPVIFYDPVKKVTGAAHSGWRGTMGEISGKMIKLMKSQYGSEPENIICAIGPGICQDCYEVSKDVYDAFDKDFFSDDPAHEWIMGRIFAPKENEKYNLDLICAVKLTLVAAGVKAENIDVTDICTCCNPEIFFSHRASKGMRGNLAMFIQS